MSRSERDKGTRGELEVRDVFRAYGFDCDRTPNSGGLRIPGDLIGTVPVHVEVKRQERLQLPIWLRQAKADAGAALPVVAFRQSRDVWYAALPLADLAAILQRAHGDGDPERPECPICAAPMSEPRRTASAVCPTHGVQPCAAIPPAAREALRFSRKRD